MLPGTEVLWENAGMTLTYPNRREPNCGAL